MWTIYDHPRDFPDDFVARKFLVSGRGPRATLDVLCFRDIEAARQSMISMGLTRIQRDPNDEPQIVEVWL